MDELISLWDDETRERMAAKLAESERLRTLIHDKAKRVIEIARAQGLIVDEASLSAQVVRSLTREDITLIGGKH
jgi:hypothetical protein